ncbi:trace amine-associated receptor 13c-like [Chanos chanos]|uniref:Trace amine-associated receptor 13c-like n=1 Tax=Chanos chanos TaxID=29144 RepID=A0A6J2W3L8_CHACN|nr:trace amine-associated receptor 13c-like [Chanos chanos]
MKYLINWTHLEGANVSLNLENVNKTDNCPMFCPEMSVSTALYVISYILVIAVVLFTMCGNLLVIISVGHFKQLHTPANILILSLAASDLLVGIILMPLYFIRLIESCWFFGLIFCQLFNYLSFHLTCVSVYNIALIAIDRYFALSNPFIYSKEISQNLIYIVVLFNWIFSLFYNFALAYCNGNFTDLVICSGECLYTQDDMWSLVDLVIVFIFPCSVIVISYMGIFFIAKRHINTIRELTAQRNATHSKNLTNSIRSERKAAKVLSIIVSVFLLCLVPYYVCTLLSGVITAASFIYIRDNIFILFYLNSCINPIIYALFYPWFRKSAKLILTCEIFNANSSRISVVG